MFMFKIIIISIIEFVCEGNIKKFLVKKLNSLLRIVILINFNDIINCVNWEGILFCVIILWVIGCYLL